VQYSMVRGACSIGDALYVSPGQPIPSLFPWSLAKVSLLGRESSPQTA
jgi:hypothetical protein